MLVVSDIDDVFLPKPNDLLVNVAESRAALESLLGRIGDMFQENSIIGSAMGPALQAGFKLMASTLPSFLYIPRYLISRDRHPSVERSLYYRRRFLLWAPEPLKTEKIQKSSAPPKWV